MSDKTQTRTIYDEVGEEAITRMVAAFYRRVETDPVLRPLYVEDDLEGAERRLRLFVIQYFGGPTNYSAERGHPRLRMRHSPFKIGEAERDAWVRAMLEAAQEAGIPEPAYNIMRRYFEDAATFLINHPFDGIFKG